MTTERVIRRLTILRDDADREPVPLRKYFHIGQPEVMEDVGEILPMISWVDDNLSRFVIADASSAVWGRAPAGGAPPILFTLPNRAVKVNDGIFVVTGPGEDSSVPHPGGKGTIHFVHLGMPTRLWDRGIVKLYVYRLDGVQMKGIAEKKR